MRENNGKNTAGPNECADFDQFGLEHADPSKTILATNSPNHPGDGITLRQNRSSSHFENSGFQHNQYPKAIFGVDLAQTSTGITLTANRSTGQS